MIDSVAEYLLLDAGLLSLYGNRTGEKSKRIFRFSQDILTYLHTHASSASFIWVGMEEYCSPNSLIHGPIITMDSIAHRVNQHLKENEPDLTILDMQKLIAEVGLSQAYCFKNNYRWSAPYSEQLLERLAKEIVKQYHIIQGLTPKCLVLDADNVLWGGILSEDGADKIQLGGGIGRFYQDFQRFLLYLYQHGVLLVVCSKNDEEDVFNVFYNHSGMILKEMHIACFQVNWENKADNIRLIAETLGIGLNSLVFVDDTPFEVESIKQLLPEVTSILFEKENIIEKLSCFHLPMQIDSDEIEKRQKTYRTNGLRKKLERETSSFNEYLSSLQMEVDIHPIQSMEYMRVADLSQRANRCTNGIRFSQAHLRSEIDHGLVIYVVYLKDKFSDLGLVGAIGCRQDTLEFFCLSCRALGRGLEDKILDFVQKNHSIRWYYQKDTSKNQSLLALLSKTFGEGKVDI